MDKAERLRTEALFNGLLSFLGLSLSLPFARCPEMWSAPRPRRPKEEEIVKWRVGGRGRRAKIVRGAGAVGVVISQGHCLAAVLERYQSVFRRLASPNKCLGRDVCCSSASPTTPAAVPPPALL